MTNKTIDFIEGIIMIPVFIGILIIMTIYNRFSKLKGKNEVEQRNWEFRNEHKKI